MAGGRGRPGSYNIFLWLRNLLYNTGRRLRGLRLCMQAQEKMRQAQGKLISSGPVNSLAGKARRPFLGEDGSLLRKGRSFIAARAF